MLLAAWAEAVHTHRLLGDRKPLHHMSVAEAHAQRPAEQQHFQPGKGSTGQKPCTAISVAMPNEVRQTNPKKRSAVW